MNRRYSIHFRFAGTKCATVHLARTGATNFESALLAFDAIRQNPRCTYARLTSQHMITWDGAPYWSEPEHYAGHNRFRIDWRKANPPTIRVWPR